MSQSGRHVWLMALPFMACSAWYYYAWLFIFAQEDSTEISFSASFAWLHWSLANFVSLTSLVKSREQNTWLICVERAYHLSRFFITLSSRFRAVKVFIPSPIKVRSWGSRCISILGSLWWIFSHKHTNLQEWWIKFLVMRLFAWQCDFHSACTNE